MFKRVGISSIGAGAAMKEIEILPNKASVPEVTFHGDCSGGEGNFTIHLS